MPPASSTGYNWTEFQAAEKAVICFVRCDSQLLLIHKKRGLGHGKINGPGGRLEPGESSRDAAVRETREEVGLIVCDVQKMADLKFAFTDGYSLEVDVFVTTQFHGTPTETEEADPFWVNVDAIPYDRMWADDQLWLPSVLAGRYVSGRFVFSDDQMLESEILGTFDS